MNEFEQAILEFPRQLNFHGIPEGRLKFKKFSPRAIVILGMGGSGLPGEVLDAVKKTLRLSTPVILWKDYGLPDAPDQSLYIFISFSGDTEETVSGLKEFLRRPERGEAAVITTGGALARIAREKRIPIVAFDAPHLTPRQATGIMFYSLVKVLRAAGIKITIPDVTVKPQAAKTEGQRLARQFRNSIILIYTDNNFHAAGYIWKIKLNETGKALAFYNVLPEADHNEIVGLAHHRVPVTVLFLKNPQNKHFSIRTAATKRILARRGVSVLETTLRGKNDLEKIWRATVLADWTSYFLAQQKKIDPKETKIISELKAALR